MFLYICDNIVNIESTIVNDNNSVTRMWHVHVTGSYAIHCVTEVWIFCCGSRRKSPLSSSCHSIGAVLGKGKLSLVSEGCDAMSFLIFSAHFVAVKRNFLD